MQKIKFWLLSVFSGGLLALSWPAIGDQWYLIFFAFIPLLWLEREILRSSARRKALNVFGFAYLSFFLFNLLTTWWIYYASDWGMAMAVICNSFFMATVFSLFSYSKKWVGERQGYFGLLFLWIGFEYLHINWELSWTWLTLGNVFANQVQWVQWYEYTGVLGGSLLILLVNLLLFSTLLRMLDRKKQGADHTEATLTPDLKITPALTSALFPLFLAAILLLMLGVYSANRFKSYQAEGEKINAAVIQPNIDPYYDKFQGIAESVQIDMMLAQAQAIVCDSIDLVILPETAFPTPSWEHDLSFMYGTEEFKSLIDNYPDLRVITGILSSKLYLKGDELSSTAKKLPGEGWYDNYNAAMHLDSSDNIDIHRKSKLVLGAEKIPFMKTFPWLKKLSISLGGTTGRYGTQEFPSVFFDGNAKRGVGPIICYESIYGEYVTQYVRGGAELLVIITNDGWWDDTPGYKQHLAYARLRAIECRRAIARSANTGISAYIDEKGQILQQTGWWEEAAITQALQLNTEQSFYVRFGDFLGRISSFVAPLFLLLAWVKSRNKTEQRLKL